jgi:hypothetical protein
VQLIIISPAKQPIPYAIRHPIVSFVAAIAHLMLSTRVMMVAISSPISAHPTQFPSFGDISAPRAVDTTHNNGGTVPRSQLVFDLLGVLIRPASVE